MSDHDATMDETPADDALMERLRAIAAAVDAPPAVVDEAARQALATRRIDAELAELLMDSSLAAATATAGGQARGDGDDVRLLTFATDRVSIELEVEPEAEGTVSLRGLVVGAGGEITVETTTAARTVPIDGGGWFTVAGVERRTVRFRLVEPAGERLVTAWTSL
jgi:hypothetical protein